VPQLHLRQCERRELPADLTVGEGASKGHVRRLLLHAVYATVQLGSRVCYGSTGRGTQTGHASASRVSSYSPYIMTYEWPRTVRTGGLRAGSASRTPTLIVVRRRASARSSW
jgi:hypothetical protein